MKRQLLAVTLLLGSATFAGCADEEHGRPMFPEPIADDDPAARVVVKTPAPAAARHGLTRQHLGQVLDAGPANFLRGVKVRAQIVDEKFQGWEIVAIEDPELRAGELAPGDVVYAVNGKRLEHPEDLGDVFELLRTAPELVVSYRRAGTARELRVPVLD